MDPLPGEEMKRRKSIQKDLNFIALKWHRLIRWLFLRDVRGPLYNIWRSYRSLRALHSSVMCQRKSLVLDKIAGSQWSRSNRRRNITYWSCFYPSCNPDFSSFWLGVASASSGSSTVSTPSSHYASLYCTVAFGLNCFRSTGQVPPNEAATSQSFLTPPAYYSKMKVIND